jgi:hypothetical protein
VNAVGGIYEGLIEKMVLAPRSAEEDCIAIGGGEHRKNNLCYDSFGHEGSFITDTHVGGETSQKVFRARQSDDAAPVFEMNQRSCGSHYSVSQLRCGIDEGCDAVEHYGALSKAGRCYQHCHIRVCLCKVYGFHGYGCGLSRLPPHASYDAFTRVFKKLNLIRERLNAQNFLSEINRSLDFKVFLKLQLPDYSIDFRKLS